MKAILLNRLLLVLAFGGLFISGVLSLGHLMDLQVPCGISRGCEAVADHPASRLFGVPVAYMGFVTYLLLAGLAAMRALKQMRNVGQLVVIGYVLSAVGVAFSLYLQYQSFMVIKAFCPWCFASATIMVITLILHAVLSQNLDTTADESVAASPAVDTVLFIALPLVAVLGIAMAGIKMKMQAAQAGQSGESSIQIPKIDPKSVIIGPEPHKIGPDNAPIVIVEFADLQCPACQTTSPKLKAFAEQFPDKMQLVFRHFPLDKHEWAHSAAAVSEFAAENGKFWEFVMAVMNMGREIQSSEELYGLAAQLGLDTDELSKRIQDPNDPIMAKVQQDLVVSDRLGIIMTPTFFIFVEGQPIIVANSGNIFEKLQQPEIAGILDK